MRPEKATKTITLHDALESLKQALWASHDVIISALFRIQNVLISGHTLASNGLPSCRPTVEGWMVACKP